MADSYIPGVCNINKAEIASRRKAGYIGLTMTIILIAILFGLDLNRFIRIILFIPIFIAAIGFLQAHNKFCVGYGAAGMHNANEGSQDTTTISDNDAVQADKQRARQMNLQAFGISIGLTLLLIAL